jgi:hypothetical protein
MTTLTLSDGRTIEVHPAADLFPMLAGDELRALGEDIARNGLQAQPVFLAGQDGEPPQLVDGRNRIAAMQLVGLPVIDDNGRILLGKLADIADPYAYVASANLHRRHLTAEAKREVIAALLRAQPEKSNRRIAEMADTSHRTVGRVRSEAEERGEVPRVTTHTDTRGRNQPATKEPSPFSRPKTSDVGQVPHAEPAPESPRPPVRNAALEEMGQLSFAHISEWCARLARILRGQEVLASVSLSDRVSLACEIMDAIGVAVADLLPPAATPAASPSPAEPAAAPAPEGQPPKRGRGRPKGARNKPKEPDPRRSAEPTAATAASELF